MKLPRTASLKTIQHDFNRAMEKIEDEFENINNRIKKLEIGGGDNEE